MPQDLTAVKTDFATHVGTVATSLLLMKQKVDEMVSRYFAMTFQVSGAAQIVQADLTGTNAYLSPAIITNFITACQAIQTAMPQGTVQNLQQAIPQEIF